MAKKLMKACEAIGEAAIQAGCRLFFGYPITPQNEIPEYMSHRLPQVGGSFVQAESEVAASNMLYGAAGSGERVFTSSSSPGISLMMEAISYMAGSELPAVIVNIMRAAPGLGGILPTFTREFWFTRRELENSKILTDVIQAINRIRSRKVIDREGNCPPTDCYLLMSTKRADLCEYLQEGLRTAMPDVRIEHDWDFALTERKPKVTKSKVVFLKFAENMEPDTQINVRNLRALTGMKEKTVKRILSELQTDPNFKSMLESFGVDYKTRQEGKTKRGYLIKAA